MQSDILTIGKNVFLGEKMSETKIRDFTQGNITSQLLTFAFPIFLSNLLQVVYNMVDMIIVGNRLGNALAGFTPFFIGLVFYVSGRWKYEARDDDAVLH